jgi:cytochrome P450
MPDMQVTHGHAAMADGSSRRDNMRHDDRDSGGQAVNAISKGPVNWDPYNQTYFKNPYPTYRRLRAEAPVYYNAEYDFYALTRFDDCQRMLMDRDSFVSRHGNLLEFIGAKNVYPSGMFIYEDPPLHAQHRSILTRVFTPKKMAALEPQIRDYCARTLDRFADGGAFDFIEHLGAEMPIRVIGMLLGIPDEDLKEVQKFTDDRLQVEPGQAMPTGREYDLEGTLFARYVDWREKHPSDDLMTELMNTEFVDQAGETRKLTRNEIMIFINILSGAGNETTNRLIGWTAKTLAEHPDQRRQIYEDRSLVPQAIEEVLRFETPGHVAGRYSVRDSEFHGVTIPAGSTVLANIGAANRDESRFVDGDSFDIHRERVSHLTFGVGFHNCLGNALARVEGRIALDEVLKRFPEWHIDVDNARLSSSSAVRGWETLPATLVPGLAVA